MKTLITLIALITLSTAVHAGDKVGGGGDIVIFDDRIILADPFVQKVGERIKQFDPETVSVLKRSERILSNYGGTSDFIEMQVLNSLIDYYFVKAIPAHSECGNRIPITLPTANARIEQIACTSGRTTWIQEDFYNRLSIRDRALLLIHERLRGLKQPLSHETIADLVTGLDVALNIYNDQLRGDWHTLSRAEMHFLEILRRRNLQVFSEDDSQISSYRISENGGGLISTNESLSRFELKNNYASVDTSIGAKAILGSGIRLLSTNVCSQRKNLELTPCQLGDGTRISFLDSGKGNAHFTTGTNTLLQRISTFDNEISISLGDSSIIENTDFLCSGFGCGSYYPGQPSFDRLTIQLGDRSRIKDSRFDSVSLKMGDDSVIDGVDWNSSRTSLSSQVQVEDHSSIRNSKFKITYGGRSLFDSTSLVLKSNSHIRFAKLSLVYSGTVPALNWVASGFRQPRWVIPANTNLDFNESAVCSRLGDDGYYDLSTTRYSQLRSIEDFTDYCIE